MSALTAATLAGLPGTASASPAVVDVCNHTPVAGHAACFAERRVDVGGMSPHVAGYTTPSGYGPADVQSAYSLPSSSAGVGARVYIVDAYDDPSAESDLATYRAQYGLSACTTANGCFQKLNQNGATSPLPSANASWAGEVSLDLDMVSATCPNCAITLVESNDSGLTNMFAAVHEATALGGKYVSMSWGAPEGSYSTSYDSSYLAATGVVYTASTGDNGYGGGRSYPATSARVIAVGGTSLRRASNSRGWTESAWSGAGSGCSAFISQPSWQSGSLGTACGNRAAADVSAVADPNTGVAVYQTYGGGGWSVYGGTSASAPIIASVYAMAAVPGVDTAAASLPYDRPDQLNDVSGGTTGSCSPAVLCGAVTGWDGPTGLGTPNGIGAFGGPAGPPSTLQVKLNVASPATPGQPTDVSITPYLPVGDAISSVAWKAGTSTCLFASTTAQSTTLTCPPTASSPTTVTATVTDTQGTKRVVSGQLRFDTATRHDLQVSLSLSGQTGTTQSACTNAPTPVTARVTDAVMGTPIKGIAVALARLRSTGTTSNLGTITTDATGTATATLSTADALTLRGSTKAVGVYNAGTAADVAVTTATCTVGLTGSISNDTAYYGNQVTVSGTVSRTDLQLGLARVPVTITQTANGRTTTIAHATTAADGSYRVTIKATTTATLTAAVAGTKAWTAASADLGSLTVLTPATEISGNLTSSANVATGGVITAAGALFRDEGGTEVPLYRSTVTLQVVAATGRAATIGSGRVAADGTWRIAAALRSSGLLRAVYTGATGQPPGSVDLSTVTVAAR